jgi:hypothetical protein
VTLMEDGSAEDPDCSAGTSVLSGGIRGDAGRNARGGGKARSGPRMEGVVFSIVFPGTASPGCSSVDSAKTSLPGDEMLGGSWDGDPRSDGVSLFAVVLAGLSPFRASAGGAPARASRRPGVCGGVAERSFGATVPYSFVARASFCSFARRSVSGWPSKASPRPCADCNAASADSAAGKGLAVRRDLMGAIWASRCARAGGVSAGLKPW